MACKHKFLNELNLDEISYDPTTLIVGTFNPSWPEKNNAEWFYGRTHDRNGKQNNNFWDVLPRIYGEASLITAGPDEWKRFCEVKKIAITDLISSIEDANIASPQHLKILGSYSDNDIATKFKHHEFVNIVKLLNQHKTIQNVYLTRGATGEAFWRELWKPVINYSIKNKIRPSTLLTPSGNARFQHGKFNKTNPSMKIDNLSDFILYSWKKVWHIIE